MLVGGLGVGDGVGVGADGNGGVPISFRVIFISIEHPFFKTIKT